MTIAQWFDENGIENLPILNICVCRGDEKGGLRKSPVFAGFRL